MGVGRLLLYYIVKKLQDMLLLIKIINFWMVLTYVTVYLPIKANPVVFFHDMSHIQIKGHLAIADQILVKVKLNSPSCPVCFLSSKHTGKPHLKQNLLGGGN